MMQRRQMRRAVACALPRFPVSAESVLKIPLRPIGPEETHAGAIGNSHLASYTDRVPDRPCRAARAESVPLYLFSEAHEKSHEQGQTSVTPVSLVLRAMLRPYRHVLRAESLKFPNSARVARTRTEPVLRTRYGCRITRTDFCFYNPRGGVRGADCWLSRWISSGAR
jgi:hypothetical protein